MPGYKLICEVCNWKGLSEDRLLAPNPFHDKSTITGCPKCKSVGCMHTVCNEPGCWDEMIGEWPAVDGYRIMCPKHMKERKPEIKAEDRIRGFLTDVATAMEKWDISYTVSVCDCDGSRERTNSNYR